MDAIVIRDLRVEALIGIHRRERHVKQTLSIDVDIGLPGTAVFASDKVADTIDYEQVALRIRDLASAQHYRLANRDASRLAFSGSRRAQARLLKPRFTPQAGEGIFDYPRG